MTVAEVQARTYKDRDSWWTVFLVDPLASRLVWLVARYPSVTPNRLTVTALLLGLGAAAAFAAATPQWLIVGAVIFHLSFVVDCMDGKVARLNGNGSLFGAWLDYILDRVRVLVCTVALMGGQYQATGEPIFLVVGGGIVFLDMFRYLNALHLSKVKTEMRRALAEKIEASPDLTAVFAPDYADVTLENVDPSVVAIHTRPELVIEREFRSRFTVFTGLRDLLVRARVRAHLVSGIEFQMAVFIIGPLAGAVLAVSVVAGALLLAFEFALIYKLWLLTTSFTRYDRALGAGAAASEPVSAPNVAWASVPMPSPGREGADAPR
ncbi:CDP-alcohol phosphatidyltransferase family protein [Micromonospora sicca]|uniref:CDP-alcohol phosphatidyltransferase n=1 Tax=Micromonospora sicca TaxID=2202420 RepID=A0A317DHB5_9ACTN|nr:CDP-alcohol phosphatidyltransferase family protein [Micromonospora sp. ATA51]PWR13732.1 CDP-alcohol phosphatidyltransferase [Micromonospora sp. 4G51]